MSGRIIQFPRNYDLQHTDERIAVTQRAISALSVVELAEYIVSLEMRLESLGDRTHFEGAKAEETKP